MLLLGCGLAAMAAVAPRIVLLIAWLAGTRWNMVFNTWIWPLLGLIFLPYTTIMYLLVWSPAGIQGLDWLWLLLGLILDLGKWGQIYNNRRGIPGYPKTAGAAPTAPAA